MLPQKPAGEVRLQVLLRKSASECAHFQHSQLHSSQHHNQLGRLVLDASLAFCGDKALRGRGDTACPKLPKIRCKRLVVTRGSQALLQPAR